MLKIMEGLVFCLTSNALTFQVIIREEYPRLFDALAMLCEQGTDRAKQVNDIYEQAVIIE